MFGTRLLIDNTLKSSNFGRLNSSSKNLVEAHDVPRHLSKPRFIKHWEPESFISLALIYLGAGISNALKGVVKKVCQSEQDML